MAKPPNWPTYTVILGASTTLTSSEVGFGARPCNVKLSPISETLRSGSSQMQRHWHLVQTMLVLGEVDARVVSECTWKISGTQNAIV